MTSVPIIRVSEHFDTCPVRKYEATIRRQRRTVRVEPRLIMFIVDISGYRRQTRHSLLQRTTEVGVPGGLARAIGTEIGLFVVANQILDVDVVRSDILIGRAVLELVVVIERGHLERL